MATTDRPIDSANHIIIVFPNHPGFCHSMIMLYNIGSDCGPCLGSDRIEQKARMARIRIAKATSGAAFVNKKKATEARLAAVESGQEVDEGPEDIFELQHHHLLQCLEKNDRQYPYFDTILPPEASSVSPDPHPALSTAAQSPHHPIIPIFRNLIRSNDQMILQVMLIPRLLSSRRREEILILLFVPFHQISFSPSSEFYL